MKPALKDDPVWADVVPVPLNQSAETQLVPIAYAPEYAEAMGYLRAVMAADECSPRALDLTERIIRSNPAHYTVWHYRVRILHKLLDAARATSAAKAEAQDDAPDEADPLTETALMDYERELLNELALDHPKSYQIWHHRQTVIQLTNDPVGELTFIMQALEDDSKNYHAWGYRQWLVQQFALWDREIADTDALLVSDVRNNAAWNERFFYWVQGPRRGRLSADDVEAELRFIAHHLSRAPNNESPWVYLRGLIRLVDADAANADQPSAYRHAIVQDLVAQYGLAPGGRLPASASTTAIAAEAKPGKGDDGPSAPVASPRPVRFCLALQLWALAHEAQRRAAPPATAAAAAAAATQGAALCDALCTLDPIRTAYWAWKRAQLAA